MGPCATTWLGVLLRTALRRTAFMKKLLRMTIAALAFVAPGALAADLPPGSYGASPDIYSPRAAALWSGFYAGVLGGYGAGRLTGSLILHVAAR